MNNRRDTRPHDVPAMRQSLGASGGLHLTTTPRSDYLHHPLHRVYHIKIRWIRLRWLIIGLLLGVALGISAFLFFGLFTLKPFPKLAQISAGPPDVSVTITEDYLNRETTARIGSGYEAGSPNLQITKLAIDLAPDNLMNLQALFVVKLPIGQIELTAGIRNRIFAQSGKLVAQMVGDPQLGNLVVPVSALPFDLNRAIPLAIDKLNNEILISELSKPFQSGVTGSGLYIDSVVTDDKSLTVRLRQK